MKNPISANELKVKGISAIESRISPETPEALITVRGKDKFIVMSVHTYNQLREAELQMALEESRREMESGDFIVESVDDHIKRISK